MDYIDSSFLEIIEFEDSLLAIKIIDTLQYYATFDITPICTNMFNAGQQFYQEFSYLEDATDEQLDSLVNLSILEGIIPEGFPRIPIEQFKSTTVSDVHDHTTCFDSCMNDYKRDKAVAISKTFVTIGVWGAIAAVGAPVFLPPAGAWAIWRLYRRARKVEKAFDACKVYCWETYGG